jgi:hypothetical protein
VGHDPGIVSAAAASDQVSGTGRRALNGDGDGGGSAPGGGGYQIAQWRTRLPQPGDELDAILLAPGALRRLAPVVGFAGPAARD